MHISYLHSQTHFYIGIWELTKTQNKLLLFFVQNLHKITSKQQLMEQVWGRIVTENSVGQIISILRNYLEQNPSKPQIIITHYGQGLSFEGKVLNDDVKKLKTVNNKQKSVKVSKNWLLLIPLVILFGLLLRGEFNQTKSQESVKSVQERSKRLLILPMTFSDDSINETDKKGMQSAISHL